MKMERFPSVLDAQPITPPEARVSGRGRRGPVALVVAALIAALFATTILPRTAPADSVTISG